jgi:hypothetical protein
MAVISTVVPIVLAFTAVVRAEINWESDETEERVKADLASSQTELTVLMSVYTTILAGTMLTAALSRTVGQPTALQNAMGVEGTAGLKLDGKKNTYLRQDHKIVGIQKDGIILKNNTAIVENQRPFMKISNSDITLAVGRSRITINDSGITFAGGDHVVSNSGGASLMVSAMTGATLVGSKVQLGLTDPATIAWIQAGLAEHNAKLAVQATAELVERAEEAVTNFTDAAAAEGELTRALFS